MQIIVLLKRTFDTEEKISIQNQRVVEEGIEYIINPYDEYAVEEAIKLKEELGGEVTILSAGSLDAEKEIRTALAMGADKGILVDLEGRETDEYSLAQILAAAIQQQEYDLLLAGNMAVDTGAGQVAVRVAELLAIPQVTTITKLKIDGQQATVERDAEGDSEVVETSLPALFTAQQGLNEPRYPSLPGIMKAKRKPLDILTVADLALADTQLAPKTALVDLFAPPEKQGGKILQGEVREQVKELAELLHKEAKVI